MLAKQKIIVVMPAYNAARTIKRTFDELPHDIIDEVILTDDGSIDRTVEIATELGISTLRHDRNRGYGAALASGFDAAQKDLVFLTDGDKQFDVGELRQFLPAMDGQTDLVIGWRAKRADPAMRKLNALGWKLLVNGLFGYTAKDVDCAFKLFRRQVWASQTIYARGATFSAEFLVKSRRLGFRIKELPVGHFPRTAGSPTGARLDVIVRAFVELFRLWRNIDRELEQDPRAGARSGSHGFKKAAS
jgi:glycosyltransferase involved in cell wall biosynthesis